MTWQWFSRFRERRGLQNFFFHGEGSEVDSQYRNLLGALDTFYAIIASVAYNQGYHLPKPKNKHAFVQWSSRLLLIKNSLLQVFAWMVLGVPAKFLSLQTVIN